MAEIAIKARGRRPKYEWNDRRDICYKMYVQDKAQIKDIIKYFSDHLGLPESDIPAPRDFSRQFQRWGFPQRRRKLPSDDEAALVERVKQLWETNHVQKQMLEALQAEGWELDELALGRLRRKHGVMMRVANGYSRDNMGPGTGKKRKRVPEQLAADEQITTTLQQAVADEIASSAVLETPAEEAARRAQRIMELQAHSDATLQSKKRRRRIRGLAHLPPDAPGLPPRYKSETSLDECKAFLQLSNELYRDVRQQFEDICTEHNIFKKTECQPGDWQSAKDRLVRDNIHLSAMLNPLHDNLDARQNALEVICSDVTKRMRTLRKRIYLKDANNILGLNPERSKELRRQFYDILRADGFQTMLLCGKEHWEELRQRWIESCPEAAELYASGLDEEKKKCVEILLRDAMKRHNDNNVSKLPHMVRADDISYGPGPGPARRAKGMSHAKEPSDESVKQRLLAYAASPPKDNAYTGNNVDPALYASSASQSAFSLPAYFRLSQESTLAVPHPKMWLFTLQSHTIGSLHAAALSKSQGAKVRKIFGIVKNNGGKEDQYRIDVDDEFDAYLEAISTTVDGKATFSVVLDPEVV